jgi:lipopolysaccharide transport system ATP-binding protein
MSAISVASLSKCYQIYERPQNRLWQFLWRGKRKYHRDFWSLRNVSFEVAQGETVGVIGRNGSGKSTLLQMLAGTLQPSFGVVATQGRVAALLELGSGFNPEFSGRENVYLNAMILGLSGQETEERFDEILNFADIGEFIDQPVKTYSSGMIVRLAFAVSVCVEPDILIIDEALSVGDMAFQFKCMERLDRLTKSGVTLLFVSHDLGAVKAFCQRAIYLVKGEVRAMGSASDMVELYLMDMRAEQKDQMTGQAIVGEKPPLNAQGGMAFGTRQGRVKSACFADTGGIRSIYVSGDTARLRISVEYDETVKYPGLSIFINDRRMVEVAGKFFTFLPLGEENTRTCEADVEVTFPILFNSGDYHITIRLEDRLGDNHMMPIDKQVSVLSFQVMRASDKHFYGLLDLPFACEVVGMTNGVK